MRSGLVFEWSVPFHWVVNLTAESASADRSALKILAPSQTYSYLRELIGLVKAALTV